MTAHAVPGTSGVFLPLPADHADDIASQAAEWIVQLSADDAVERTQARADFAAWVAADPSHAVAAARMQGIIDQAQRLRGGANGSGEGSSTAASLAALKATHLFEKNLGQIHGRTRPTKRAGMALVLAFSMVLPAWFTLQGESPVAIVSAWTADLRTPTGQWGTHTLSDGTRVTLSSASAVNLHFDTQRRTLDLVRGEILVEVAHDTTRPFVVETAHGSVRALGTRFVVNRQEQDTVLTMLESRVSVQTAAQRVTPIASGAASSATDGAVVNAGQRVHIHADALSSIEVINGRSVDDAWKFHQLVVQDRPLPDVLDDLDRYRHGHIQYDRSKLQGIQVSAVLPLDDTDRALQLLVDSFPQLRVRKLTGYFVMVDVLTQRERR